MVSRAGSSAAHMKHVFLVLIVLLTGCEKEEEKTAQPTAEVREFHPRAEVTQAGLPDFAAFTDVKAKKAAFFDFLLPLIEEANAEISMEREQLTAMLQAPKLSKAEQQRLAEMVRRYRVNRNGSTEQIKRLLEKINTIPPSLAMAQAANESAWGTSRFATEGNNLFGQWCFSKGCGLVPEYRADEAIHEVAVFKTPFLSVRSYMLNINRHTEYTELRELRRQEIRELGYSTGLTLAGGLTGYSSRGDEYVEEVRSMIRYNGLDRYDHPGAE